MGKVHAAIDGTISEFIQAQRMFFVGSAPADGDGHVNVSPKGGDSFRILGPTTVAYVDYFGSGVETVAHLRENGRIVIMFCAFDGPPKIVRLHGRGRVVLPTQPEFAELRSQFAKERTHAQRAVIVVDVHRVADSCGYSVPRMTFVEDRNILDLHQLKKPT